LAIVISGVVLLVSRHPGHFPVASAQAVLILTLSVIPNRCFVFSRVSPGISLLLALIPFRVFIGANYPSDILWIGLGLFMAFCLFGFLPLSLVLSYVRLVQGEKVTYA
jgi:hypothetical protein